MSDTPRTDAVEHELEQGSLGGYMRRCQDGGWVEADFARQIERENAKLNAENAMLRANIAARPD